MVRLDRSLTWIFPASDYGFRYRKAMVYPIPFEFVEICARPIHLGIA
jgi:hypothetical protein